MPGKTALSDLILPLFPKEGKPYNETALTETVRCTGWIARRSVDNQNGMRTVHAYTRRLYGSNLSDSLEWNPSVSIGADALSTP